MTSDARECGQRGNDVARFVNPAAITPVGAPIGGTSIELAAGFTLAVSQRTSLYGELGKQWASGERGTRGQLDQCGSGRACEVVTKLWAGQALGLRSSTCYGQVPARAPLRVQTSRRDGRANLGTSSAGSMLRFVAHVDLRRRRVAGCRTRGLLVDVGLAAR